MNKIIEATPAEIVTYSTRGQSNEKVDRAKRYSQIIEVLKEHPDMTAKQVAVKMLEKGYIPTSERNFTAPRLTELYQDGIVDTIGKTKCEYTGKTVAVYRLAKKED